MMATRKYINGRSWLLLFLAINFWPLTLSADSIEEQLYRQGNRHYSRAQYAQAAEKWQSILRSGYVSGELHYNLGNAYYKMNDIGRAILHYEKALPYMPDDEDLINNLDMARLKTKDKIAKVPEFFLAKVINGFMDIFTIPIAGYLALGSFYLLGIVAIVNLKQWIAPSLGNILVIAMIAVSVFLGSVFAIKSYRHATTQTAIVLADELNAKSEPQNSASTLFIIHEGLKVLITRQDGRWVEIKLPDGNKGWVELTSLGKI